MSHLLFYSYAFAPFGTYVATVKPALFLPPQHVCIAILNERTAFVHLSGVVNFADEFEYEYNSERKKWTAKLSEKFENTLQRYHCCISDIEVTDKSLEVGLVLPVIGSLVVQLNKQSGLDEAFDSVANGHEVGGVDDCPFQAATHRVQRAITPRARRSARRPRRPRRRCRAARRGLRI